MMYSSKNLLILVATIQLLSCLASLAEACSGSNHKVSSLVLAMTWQPGVCKSGIVKCKQYSNVFSIHGFWPQAREGNLEYCCTNDYYLDKKLSPIKRSLLINWPSLKSGPEDSAWQYQYNKHGSCAIGKVAAARDIKEYFSRAVQEFTKFELAKVLLDGGFKIKTQTEYFGSDIISYLYDVFGSEFQIVCEPMGQSRVVTEIRACFGTDMRQQNCPYTKKACKGRVTFQ